MKKMKIAALLLTVVTLTGCGQDIETNPSIFEPIPEEELVEEAPQINQNIIVLDKQDAPNVQEPQTEVAEEPTYEEEPAAIEPETLEYEIELEDTQWAELSDDNSIITFPEEEIITEEIPAEETTQEPAPEYSQITGDYVAMYENYLRSQIPAEYFSVIDVLRYDGVPAVDAETLKNANKYYRDYLLFGQPSGLCVRSYGIDANTSTVVNVEFEKESEEDINRYINRIADKFGVYVYPSQEETMLHTWERIHDVMAYCDSYTFASMGQCLDGERGVCWAYSQIARTLLSLEGINARCVTGCLDGEGHEWIEAEIDGQILTLEATARNPYPVAGSVYQEFYEF